MSELNVGDEKSKEERGRGVERRTRRKIGMGVPLLTLGVSALLEVLALESHESSSHTRKGDQSLLRENSLNGS